MHKHGRAFFIFIGWLLVWASASGQCPQPGFTISDTVCIDQTFPIVNTSTDAQRYEWDFCPGDLAGMPAVTELLGVPGANVLATISTVTDGTNWYAFFFSRDNNLLFRLDYGSSISNTPVLVSVGSLGALISRPEPIDFVKEGNDWYALTANTFGNSNLIRLHFGTSLTNVPTVTDLGNFGGRLKNPRGLKIGHDDGNYVAVLTNNQDNTLALVNFGSTITASPGSSDVLMVSSLGANLELVSTALIRDCDQWYGVTVARATAEVYKLSFGANLFSLPVITRIPLSLAGGGGFFNVQLTYDGGFAAMLMTMSGRLVYLDLGPSLAGNSPVATDMGKLPLLADVSGLAIVRNGTGWLGFCPNYSANKIYKLTFPDRCGSQPSFSVTETPSGMIYDSPGSKKISLTAYGPGGDKSMSKSVFVPGVPVINFTVEGSAPHFKAVLAPGANVTDWQWDFGDGTSASGSSVTHTFGADRIYDITLTARSECNQVASISRKVGVVNNTALNCPLPSYSLPDTVCSDEAFSLVNNTFAGERFEWDFCSGDLEGTPDFRAVTTLGMMGNPLDMEIVHDGANWFGFVCNWSDHRLYRLDFGNSLSNVPAVTSLGNIGGLLFLPVGISIIKEGSKWYGMLVNVLGSSTKNLIRLDFGSSLTNVPTGANIPAVSALLNNPRNLELVSDNGRVVALIPCSGDHKLIVVDFKNTITHQPTAADIIAVDFASSNPKPWDIAVTKECNRWYGLMAGYEGKLFRLEFGNELFSNPAVRDISAAINGQGSPVKINLYKETTANAFVFTQTGNFFRLGFGRDISSIPTIHSINTRGLLMDGQAMCLQKSNSTWEGFMINWQSKRLVRWTFPENCDVNVRTSTDANPAGVAYSGSGWRKVSLTAYDWNQNSSTSTDSVFVRQAVTGAFSTTSQCVGTETLFRVTSVLNGNRIVSYRWNFGDGSSSTEASPKHTYSVATTFNVTLELTDVCGKIVTLTRPVVIYGNLSPDFNGPTAFCSSEEVTFTEATRPNGDQPVAWQWNFGNDSTATGQSISYRYPRPGSYNVTLTVTGISGCSTSISKQVEVKPGVSVDFESDRSCFGDLITFQDRSVIAEGTTFASRRWRFGDGATSEEQNPVHEYRSSGTYTVSLTVETAAGCSITQSRTIRIKQLPRAAFSNSLACSGEAVLFSDESNPVEGGVVAWQWDFGDTASGEKNSSDEQSPWHVFSRPGTYSIKLKVTTSYGCRDSVFQQVTVVESPQAGFTHAANCGEKTVAFADASLARPGAAIESRYWEFGDGSTSLEPNPVHTYEAAGTYTVSLFVTSSTRCGSTVQQTIAIYDPPLADFAVPDAVCPGVPVQFKDASKTSPGDEVARWEWDFGAAGKQSGPSPLVTFAPVSTPFPVTLVITTTSGCQLTVTKEVTVQSAPRPDFTFEAAASLDPLKLSFTNTSSADAVAFTWNFGDGTSSGQRSPVHGYAAAGTYTVTLTARNAAGCPVTYAREVTVTAVFQGYELKLEAAFAQRTATATALQVKLLNNSTRPIRAITFKVTLEKATSFSQSWDGVIEPGKRLTYRIELPAGATIDGGEPVCVVARDETNQQYSNRQCLSTLDQFTLLAPFPNPASGLIRLAYILPGQGRVTFCLIDPLGREIIQAEAREDTAGYHERTLNLPGLSKGIYLVRVRFEGQEQVRKIFVQ